MPRAIGENDENRPVRVNQLEGPDDSDRARFGFKRRGVGAQSVPKLPPASHHGGDGGMLSGRSLAKTASATALSKPAAPPAANATPSVETPRCWNQELAQEATEPQRVNITALVDQVLGDPDDMLPIIRLKPIATQYMYKEKIAEQQEHITQLKAALESQRRNRLELNRALVPVQEEMSAHHLEKQALMRDLNSRQQQLWAAEQQASSLREAAETAADEEVFLREQRDKDVAQIKSLTRELKDVEGELWAARKDAEEARQLCQTQELALEEARTNEKQQVAESVRQVKESMLLLEQQTEEAKDHQSKMHALLQEQSAKASAALVELEEVKKELAIASQERDEAVQAKQHTDDLRQQIAQSMRELNEQRVQLTAREVELSTTRSQLAEQENLCSAALKREAELKLSLHQATRERAEEGSRLSDKEVELESLRVQLAEKEAAHSASQRREASLKEAAAKQQALIEALKTEFADEGENAQSQLRSLEERLAEVEACRAQEGKEHKAAEQEHAKLKDLCEQQSQQIEQLVVERHDLQLNLRDTEQRLREKLASLESAGREGAQKLRHEQETIGNLRSELKALRATEAELRNNSTASAVEAAQMQSELILLRQQTAELKQGQQKAEVEHERLVESVAESQLALRACQDQLASSQRKISDLQAEAAGAQASLQAKSEQAEELQKEKRALEVECRSYREHRDSSNQQQMEAIAELKLTVDKLTQKVDASQRELGIQQGNMMQQAGYIKGLEEQLSKADANRRELHNALQELRGNIRVLCRVRPLPNASSPLALKEGAEPNKLALTVGMECYNFAFDKVFSPAHGQEDVFGEVAGVVQSALDGYKVCVFAYGQTGSGKTFTMQGHESPEQWGLIPRSLHQIFEQAASMRENGWTWSLQASFIEVYNETLRDLLGGNSSGSTVPPAHVIKHDDRWGSIVTNVTAVEVDSVAQITALMGRAARQRAVGATDMNTQSSRSHSIFALYLEGRHELQNMELHGALHLVDLAGSERLDRSGSTGERLKETQNINKSLSSLADVFHAKAEGRSHVPFRNSKLTQLMEPCLSGHGKTIMVVNVGPEHASAHETLCSLRFASQVSQCDTGGKPKRNARTPMPSPGISTCSGSPGQPAAFAQFTRPSSAGVPFATAARRRGRT